MRRGLPIRFIAPCVALLALAACAAKRPVLYPNAVYRQAGIDAAQRDVDACLDFARSQGHSAEPGAHAGAEAAEGAAVGAATGAAVGAVLGGAGRGAAAGAAGGGAHSLLHGLFHWRDPDPIERRFVHECLREHGYRVIGWE
jgi:hypothetical protein